MPTVGIVKGDFVATINCGSTEAPAGGAIDTAPTIRQCNVPNGLLLEATDAAESRYRMMIAPGEPDCNSNNGLLVGAVIGEGVLVCGFSPKAILLLTVTPAFLLICWA